MASPGTICAACGAVHGITPEIWNIWEYISGRWYCPCCKAYARSARASRDHSHSSSCDYGPPARPRDEKVVRIFRGPDAEHRKNVGGYPDTVILKSGDETRVYKGSDASYRAKTGQPPDLVIDGDADGISLGDVLD